MRRLLALPLIALPLLGLTACGGSGGSSPAASGSPSAGAALSKADYVTQANGICTSAKADLDKLPRPTAAAEFETYLDASVGRAKKATQDLSALVPPPEDAEALRSKLTGPLSDQVTAIEAITPQFKEAAKAPDPRKAFSEITPPKLPTPDAAFLNSYGLQACAGLSSQGGS